MKTLLFKLSILMAASFAVISGYSQCTNTSSYGSATAPTNSTPVEITTLQYEEEYNTISGVVAGETYESASDCGSYITVHSGTYDGPVVAHGWNPLSWTATTSGDHFIHYNTDAGCGTATTFCTTTITCTSCSGGGGCSDCSSAQVIPSGTSFPFTDVGTTCDACDNYSSSDACGTSYMNGEDFVYEYTPSSDIDVTVDLTSDATYVGVIVSEGCPDVGTCVGSPATNSGADASGGPYSLSAGITYYFTVSTYPSPDCIPNYTLTIDEYDIGSCSTCASAEVIPSGTSFPYNHSGTTCGACNNYTETDACGTSYMNGEDFVYEYTPSSDINVTVDLTSDATWVGVAVTEGCPDVGTCVGSPATSSDADASGGPYSLSAGITYYFTVSTYPSPDCIPNYTLTIDDGGNTIEGSETCEDAMAVCAEEGGVGVNFEITENDPEVDYPTDQCSFLVNPTWWYFQIESLGDIEMQIASSCGDVDFACYGPFDNLSCDPADLTGSGSYTWYDSGNSGSTTTNTNACPVDNLATPSGNLTDAGYSIDDTEILNINPVNVGEYYIVIIGNYGNCTGTVDFNQTNIGDAGAGSVDCDIVSDCNISSISATTACTNSTYSVSGEIFFTDPPSDGTLTICEGAVCQTFTPPFTSPTAYTLTNLTADGTQHQLTGTFASSTTNCDKISNYTAPDKMNVIYSSTPATCYGNDGTVTVESVTNGVGPDYTFTWSNNETGETVTGLEAGSYYVATIVDNSNDGCTAIYDPNPNTVDITSTTETGNTYNWYGNISSNWENGKNWCRETTPENPQSTTDDVIVQDVGIDCIIPDDGIVYKCHNITIDGVLKEAGNNSNLNVSGAWQNNNTFTQNGGTITFEGSSLQSVQTGGSSFGNTVVNNTGDGLTLSDNMTIQSSLTLTDGIINTGANYTIVTNTNYDAVSGHNSESYVYGNLRRYILQNADLYDFPVGTSTAYRLAQLDNKNMSGATYLDAKFITSFSNTGALDPAIAIDNGTPYTSVATEGIWQIQPNSAISGSYSINLWFDDGGGPEPFAGLVDNSFGPLKRPDGSTSAETWSAEEGTLNAAGSLGRTVAGGYAARNSLATFSEFAIGRADNPLPIELLSFSGNCLDDIVVLNWTTASETNNDFFTIYRSTSPESFKTISKVAGQGSSNHTHEYVYIDKNPESGHLYYKLKQTDFDGATSWSEVVFVSCQQDTDGFYITPNPFQDKLNITFNEPTNQTCHISIYDMLGKIVYEDEIPAKTQRITIEDIEHLMPGTYYLKLQSQDVIKTQKLIKM